MKLPRNKYTLFAAAWFVLLWAALLRESGGHTPPPFPNFDKAAHCAAFFAQFWLAARAWLEDGRRPPYLPLAAAALLLAAATETAQAWFTATGAVCKTGRLKRQNGGLNRLILRQFVQFRLQNQSVIRAQHIFPVFQILCVPRKKVMQ